MLFVMKPVLSSILFFGAPVLAEDMKFDLSWIKALNKEAEKLAQSSQTEAKEIVDQALKASTEQKHCRVAKSLAHDAKESVRHNLELSDSDRHKRYPNLLVFVSFSMPLETLKSLTKQVNQLGENVVLRGLVNSSFRQTAEKVKELKQEVIIDPTLFEEYQIKVVPTFVLQSQRFTKNEALKDESYDQLKGNVSLEYVLEQIISKGTAKTEAIELLKRLGTKP